ncbi:peptidyl-prolyl cis-trans isomerase SurA [Sinobacterium caligoides]|uniref:Chaperone SurA n=1 Tax=Sinobacterium caligoides TaxID=933926 RepID=A0A3N2DP53_9GAMM|nr:peptidylprolyl isomerase [Sinobacterium caligoides]ROS01546.1 peptidyl-prolyl cis-trans isomerase SurA [Sinobacterium caligoides]
MTDKTLQLTQRFIQSVKRCTHIAALSLLLLPGYSQAEVKIIDKVVAVVDDGIIMESELDERIEQVQYNIKSQGRPLPAKDTLRKDILDTMIVENLQLQMGQRAGVRISDQQLNQAMATIAKQNGMQLKQFRKALEKDGLSYKATREQIRREMILQQVQAGNINNRIQITDQEVENFLTSKQGSALTATQYHLAHLFYSLENGGKKEAGMAALNKAKRAIEKGQKLGAWQKAHSEAGRIQGGDLGWRRSEDLPGVFAEVAPTLKVGQVSAPFASESGVHLVQLLEKRGAGKMIEQTKARHILLKTSAIRNDQQAQDQLNKLRQRILDGEDFAALAKKYSEDIGSASEGGDLGWSQKGQFVPAFEKTMAASAPGDISKPFKSQFGWHILQVEERRQHDASSDQQQRAARNYIHQRKFKEELDAWLLKIRDEAYIDIKS